jgi:hypothetical protein
MQIDNQHIIRPGMLNTIPSTLSPSTDYGYGMESSMLNSPLEVIPQGVSYKTYYKYLLLSSSYSHQLW